MSNLKNQIKRIYVDIDCLLDTRLGTLIKIDPRFAYNVSDNKNYYLRQEDIFKDKDQTLDREIYKKVFCKYKEEIIRSSLKTKMFAFLYELCKVFLNQATSTPYLSSIEIELNLYPYDFTQEEGTTILNLVSSILKDSIDISYINKSPKELTVDYIYESHCAMIMYDCSNWLNENNKGLQSRKLKEIALYIPKLNFVRQLTQEESKPFNERGVNPFELLKILMCEFITMQFLPVSLYCADTPANLKEYS